MLVGYKLIRESDGATVLEYGGTYGIVPEIPNPIFLPGGDQIHGAFVGRISADYSLVEWHATPPLATPADILAAKQRVAVFADQMAAAVTGPVPETERASWPTKEVAARAFLAGTASAAQTAMLEAEAALTNETPTHLAEIIVANAESYIEIAGMIAGQRRITMAALDSLAIGTATVEDVEVVLLNARAQAEAMLAQITG